MEQQQGGRQDWIQRLIEVLSERAIGPLMTWKDTKVMRPPREPRPERLPASDSGSSFQR